MLLFFMLDYCTKYEITRLIPYESSKSVVTGFFNLVNIHNSGIAFGIFAHLSQVYRVIFLCGISFAVFVAVVILIVKGKNRNTFFVLGLSLLAGGAWPPAVAAFIMSWISVGVITLPFEAKIFSWRFALIRNALTLITAYFSGLLLGGLL